MLRTPGSWKDNHQCKWTTPGCFIMNALLSYTEDCDMLLEIAPKETKEESDEMTSEDVKKARALLATHEAVMDNYHCIGEDKGVLKLKRIHPSHCEICKRTHDNSDAYATIYKGHVHLRCYRDDTKGSVYIGFIGEKEVIPVKFGAIKKMMRDLAKAQESLEQTGMSNKEKTQLGADQAKIFEEAKRAAKENDKTVANIPSFYFTDFNKFHKKTFTNMEQFHRYVKQTVAKIVMGGNCLYITSDFWKDTKHYTELSNLPCDRKNEAYSFSIISPNFEMSMPVDIKKNPMFLVKKFGDVINDYTMEHFYKSVDFLPYLIAPTKEDTEIFNMFEGFKFPFINTREPAESVQPWINHILEVVCNGNVEQAKKLTQWMAHIIQKPMQKAFAVILYGKQGTGKSILYEFFTRCIGKDLGLQVGKLEDLTQTHNTHMRGKLIINANEATNQPAIRDVNILKGLITETDLIINPKNVNQYTVSNFSRLMITSNYKQCMRLDADDRRYFCLEISDKKKNNDEYFAPLVDGLTNEQTQQDFFTYLANYDISDFHPQRPPMTKIKCEMIGIQISNVVAFMLAVCENSVMGLEYEEETAEVMLSCVNVFRCYDDWCRENDAKGSRLNKGGFADSLKETFEIDVVRPRVDGKQIRSFKISRAEMLSHFQTHFVKEDFEYVIA
jgi:hypothetical protein